MRVSSVGWVTGARGPVTEREAPGGAGAEEPGGGGRGAGERVNNWRKPVGAKPDKWSTT